VGFVFEIDDLFYHILIDDKRRRAYENSPPEPGTCLAVKGSANVCYRYAFVIACGDVSIMALSYLKYAFNLGDGISEAWTLGMWQVQTFMLLRGSIFAVVGIHLSLRARHAKHPAHVSDAGTQFRASRRSSSGATDSDRTRSLRHSSSHLSVDRFRLLLSGGFVIAATTFALKVVYQGLSNRLSWTVACLETARSSSSTGSG